MEKRRLFKKDENGIMINFIFFDLLNYFFIMFNFIQITESPLGFAGAVTSTDPSPVYVSDKVKSST